MENYTGKVENFSEFNTYEDFLDSQITSLDLFYLEDEELARQLVELGYRGHSEILKREEFKAKKHLMEVNRLEKTQQQKLKGTQIDLSGKPLLLELSKREEANLNGNLATIIFIRDFNSKNKEVSGYIDFAHRLKTEDFSIYFSGKKKLMPKPTDLSYFNWETQLSRANSSPNYLVITSNPSGLLFKNLKDRKIINVDPKSISPGENSLRIDIESPSYQQAIIFDHVMRRKT